jgi:hypothetical protein
MPALGRFAVREAVEMVLSMTWLRMGQGASLKRMISTAVSPS